jgi:drug/metabolite transporter (DMT)-like permease
MTERGSDPPHAGAARVAKHRATLFGLGAILLWSALALMTAASGEVPPFQLAALCFGIAGGVGAASWLLRPGAAAALRQSAPVWILGVAGLFGYHALYFTALRLAPPAEAGLISYLWPLLIVLFSSLLPGERLEARHVAAALLGLAGVAVLGWGRMSGAAPGASTLAGYGLALACAFVWSGYSVLSRRFGTVPTDAVTGFCLATAALSLLCHLALEATRWPQDGWQWLAMLGLGLGPVGAAFYLWDAGMKHGDIKLLGVASYAAPVLSTLLLVAAGFAQASLGLGLACLLIVGGAVVASWPSIRQAIKRQRGSR